MYTGGELHCTWMQTGWGGSLEISHHAMQCAIHIATHVELSCIKDFFFNSLYEQKLPSIE